MTREEFVQTPVGDFLALLERWSHEQRRKDARVALQCFVTAVALGVKREDNSNLQIEDFMPGESKTDEQSPEEMLALVSGLAEKYGDSR